MKNPFSPPDIFSAKKVLAIQPHYDDNDISAGGTMAALVENGAELIYLTVTDDLVGHVDQSLPDEEMTRQLRDDQRRAGDIIGVKEQHWLGYPDAGDYSYFDVRQDLIKHIRMIRPDFIITVDPWMPYEAHNDHFLVGKAAAEAAILFTLPRLVTDDEVDQTFEPFELLGIAFYGTAYPNQIVDISAVHARKHKAVSQYHAQFTDKDMAALLAFLDYKEKDFARDKDFEYGEPIKALQTLHLHGYPQAVFT